MSLVTVSFKGLFIASAIVRLALLFYGIYQDEHSVLKYTDIDYYVFYDSLISLVKDNGSPYDRDTFRYTPLLTYVMYPCLWNIHLGKVLFIIFDLLCGVCIHKILQKTNTKYPVYGTALWLLNPMVIAISTRGNAESIMSLLMLLCIYLFIKKSYTLSAFVYGLSIHFKIYPIIYSVPFSCYFLSKFIKKRQFKYIINWVLFGFVSLITLLSITYLVYTKFGDEFLEHTYFYHMIRSDHRHNFSVWNMVLYMEQIPQVIKQDLFVNNNQYGFFKIDKILDNKSLSTIPQLFICTIVPIILFFKETNTSNSLKKLIKIIAIQTMLFVHFNKVITSQYFIWYLTYLPFFVDYFIDKFTNKKYFELIKLASVWILSQGVWLLCGFMLEFKNKNVFVELFVAGCVMLIGNVYVIGKLIEAV
ncbi:unnamed protein product [Hanseniaspora opuntiae]